VRSIHCTLPTSRLSSNHPLLFSELVLILRIQAASVSVFFLELRWDDIQQLGREDILTVRSRQPVVQRDWPRFTQ